jgi:DNA replication and repair protein RecF
MRIQDLTIENLRVIERMTLTPVPGINIFCGPNGAGKTSVLEAIYLAGRGRSFRHNESAPMVRHGADVARLLLHIAADEENDRISTLGIARGASQLEARLNGKDLTRRSALAEALPVQWVGSQPQRFFELGPEVRRNFLDMLLFHVEHSYLHRLNEYHRVLKQRNAALRICDRAGAQAWDTLLSELSEQISRSRSDLWNDLWERARSMAANWGLTTLLDARIRGGSKGSRTLLEDLRSRIDEDLSRGFTGQGTHRFDVTITERTSTRNAAKSLSRGQLKLWVLALNLAASDTIEASSRGERPVLLIDDLSAELDLANRTRVLKAVLDRGGQAFVTRLSDDVLPMLDQTALFHVEHGRLRDP